MECYGAHGVKLQSLSEAFSAASPGMLYELLSPCRDESNRVSASRMALLWLPLEMEFPRKPWCIIEMSRGSQPFERDVELRIALDAAIREAARRQATILLFEGSNLENWIEFGATEHGVRLWRMHVASINESPHQWMERLRSLKPGICSISPPLQRSEVEKRIDIPWRDEVAFALADQVRVLDLRPQGALAQLVRQRLANERSALGDSFVTASRTATPSTWLRITERSRELIQNDLMHEGGIGWLFEQPPVNGDMWHTEQEPMGTNAKIMTWQSWLERESTPDAHDDEAYLVHCTRDAEQCWPDESREAWQRRIYWSRDARFNDPCESLLRIVSTKRLIGTSKTTRGATPVVCFSAAPLNQLLSRRTYRTHLRRWDYEPYGIGIRRTWLEGRGGKPVTYGDRETWQAMPQSERPWFQDRGTTFDWTQECEWRCVREVDLGALGPYDGFVFVPGPRDAERIARAGCAWPILIMDES